MKNIRKFETTAEMENAVLENVSINYNVETDGVVALNKPSVIDYSAMYTTFEALEDGILSFVMKSSDDDIQYSKDNGSTWTSLASGETVSVVTGDKVIWKSTITPGSGRKPGIGIFLSSNKFNVSGNIMSLLYGDDFKEQTSLEGKDSAFSELFNNCSYLTDTSNLILLSTTLAKSCYSSMFEGCTNLTTAPELPATTLASDCYLEMFNGCTSLTTSPELSATTLARACYRSMFSGCTSLTTAPELPVTTLADYCYYEMFNGCTNLNNITMLATDISATNCLLNWVKGVSSIGTFVKHPDIESLPTGVSGIPEGWAVENYQA